MRPSEMAQLVAVRFDARMLGKQASTGRPSLYEIQQIKSLGGSARLITAVSQGEISKAAIVGASTSDVAWAGALAAHRGIIEAFIETAAPYSAWARLAVDGFVRAPLGGRVVAATGGLEAGDAGEGLARAVTKMALTKAPLTRRNAMALIVVSRELIAAQTAAGAAFFQRELSKALGAAVDGALVAVASDGVTPIASNGVANARRDVHDLLDAVHQKGGEHLAFLAHPRVANAASMATDDMGRPMFPDAEAQGGLIAGVPVLVTDAVPNDQLILLDASGFGAGFEDADLQVSENAVIQMSDTPTQDATTGTGSTGVSMFQCSGAAVRLVMDFGIERGRDDAVAILDGIDWRNALDS